MRRKSLAEARRLFRARKFPEVIRTLEPEVLRFRESFDYFLLLGLSCLRTGDLGGAMSYLGRAHQLNREDSRPALAQAAIHFKRAETEKALALWLEVLENEPSNKVARRGMELLKKGLSNERIQDFVDSGRIAKLYPALPPRPVPVAWIIGVLVTLILAGSVYIGLRIIRPMKPVRAGVEEVEIPKDLPRVIEDGRPGGVYVLTERQVKRGFEQAKKHLLSYRDNLAVVEINRLLLSNATLPVRERARVLKAFIGRPDFSSFKDGYSYREIEKEPALYDGTYVAWKGKVANLTMEKDSIHFDLLVGYEKETELEGIVPVSLTFAVELENGIPLEILGQVSTAEGKIRLDGISLHKLGMSR
jgi:tetratricopeptide (TPR) repeat protein